MIAFVWLIAIVLSVVAAAYVLAAIVAAVRALQPQLAAVAGAVGVVFVGVLFGVNNPFVVAAVAIASGLAGVTLLRRLTRNASHAGQTLKLSAAHLALLAGSFLFLIPFAWLISTSLKPDDEMAVFPPVWIPTQQVTTPTLKNADNKPAGLSWYSPGGARVERK
jgi:multiple sugar transport system permease protein